MCRAIGGTWALGTARGWVHWIDLAEPTPADLAELAKRFPLHPLAIEDATGTGRLPKAEQIANDELFVVTVSVGREGDAVAVRQTAVLMGTDNVISAVSQSALLEQQRTGTVPKQLAAWAAILAVPNAIASIYGMNFRIMPELAWDYGYPVVLAFMLLVSLTLYWRFKLSRWL